jgi:hypothetical protein
MKASALMWTPSIFWGWIGLYPGSANFAIPGCTKSSCKRHPGRLKCSSMKQVITALFRGLASRRPALPARPIIEPPFTDEQLAALRLRNNERAAEKIVALGTRYVLHTAPPGADAVLADFLKKPA